MFAVNKIVTADQVANAGLVPNSLFRANRVRFSKKEYASLTEVKELILLLSYVVNQPDQLCFKPVKFHSLSGKATHYKVKVYSRVSPSFDFIYGRTEYEVLGAKLSQELRRKLDALTKSDEDKLSPFLVSVSDPSDLDDRLVYAFIERKRVCIGGDQFGSDYAAGFRITILPSIEQL